MKYFNSKVILLGVLLILVVLLYVPTLKTGFLTDDFLDCNHTLSEVPASFSSQYGGGYRPLMILSWALDNTIWGVENQTGWHLTNLLLLLVSSSLMYIFLGRFVSRHPAVYAGTALFVFSFPMAVAVARVSWRTTVLALIPFLASLILTALWSGGRNRKWMPYAAAFMYLVSLLVKETAVAALPVIVAVAYCSSQGKVKRRNTILSFFTALVPLTIYGVLRYRAMGFGVNYSESTSYGLFMLKNMMVQNAAVWQPWLSGISARVLFLLYPVAVYFAVPEWKNRILVFSLGIFLMLPVSNLTLRPDFSVAALPGAALFTALFVQRLYGKKFLYPALFVLLAGVILFSRDEVRTLREASDYVERTTVRLGEIAEELPGNGPIFISGADRTVGSYGTFWPGEYMAPMECLGITPDRLVTGTERIWEVLETENEPGFIVFMDENGIQYTSVPVSVDMYADIPDTTVHLDGSTIAVNLTGYPSCTGSEESGSVYIVSPVFTDSVVVVVPEIINGEAVYNLAAEPVWLASDSGTVLLVEGPVNLVFSSRNISMESALRNMEDKLQHR